MYFRLVQRDYNYDQQNDDEIDSITTERLRCFSLLSWPSRNFGTLKYSIRKFDKRVDSRARNFSGR